MKKLIIPILAALAMTGNAQETPTAPDYGDFTVDAQVRALGEFRTGLGSPSEEISPSNFFANDRVRLSFGWERKNISLKISAQHTGHWQDAAHKYLSGNIALHEAWAKMTFGKGFFAQVGRQELSFDDERLFGTHDWAPTGRAHDALRLGWSNERHQLQAIASFNQTADVVDDINYYDPSATERKLYKNMQTLWYHLGSPWQAFQISFLFTNQGVSSENGGGTNFMQTFGTYMDYSVRKFFLDLSLYYQTGKDRMDADVRAFMMGADMGWHLSPKWTLTFGDDYMSGSDGMPGTNRTFNLLYGSHHNFLGSMDYFGFGALPTYGLNDLHVQTTAKFSPKVDMNMGVHWFATARRINDYLKDPTEHITDPLKIRLMDQYNGQHRFSQSLGGEIDIDVAYRPWKDVTLRAGYSMMVASESMQLLKGADAGTIHNWGWLSFDINPTVFSTRHRRQ